MADKHETWQFLDSETCEHTVTSRFKVEIEMEVTAEIYKTIDNDWAWSVNLPGHAGGSGFADTHDLALEQANAAANRLAELVGKSLVGITRITHKA